MDGLRAMYALGPQRMAIDLLIVPYSANSITYVSQLFMPEPTLLDCPRDCYHKL